MRARDRVQFPQWPFAMESSADTMGQEVGQGRRGQKRKRKVATGTERAARTLERAAAKRRATRASIQRETRDDRTWTSSLTMYRQLGQSHEQTAYMEPIREMQRQLANTDKWLQGLEDKTEAGGVRQVTRSVRALQTVARQLGEKVQQLERDNERWRHHFSKQFMEHLQAQRTVGPLPPVHHSYTQAAPTS